METTKRVYIIAKVTGLPVWQVVAKYDKAKNQILKHGYLPICPIDYVPATMDWHQAMKICIPLMLSCDAYTIIDPIHTTAGGTIEDTIARWVNLPQIYFSKL